MDLRQFFRRYLLVSICFHIARKQVVAVSSGNLESSEVDVMQVDLVRYGKETVIGRKNSEELFFSSHKCSL